MKNTLQHDSLELKSFFAQNEQWVSDSVELLKNKDLSDLHRDIAKRAMEAQSGWLKLRLKANLTQSEKTERTHLHHTLQVVVPAYRRSASLLSNLGNVKPSRDGVSMAASRLAVFLLGMVAQSSVLEGAAHAHCMGAGVNTVLPSGLTPAHRSVALDILRDNAGLFGACPAWVENVVVRPMHVSAATVLKENTQRSEGLQRLALRAKIIALALLTEDEERLLMRVL